MILLFKSSAEEHVVTHAGEVLARMGLSCQTVRSSSAVFVVVLDDVSTISTHVFSQIAGVERVIRTGPQTSLVFKKGRTSLTVGNVVLGGDRPIVIAGPCSVEGEAQLLHAARLVKQAGAQMLRGGVFKPRSSPYDFQGLGTEGLRYLAAARSATGLPIVSEVMSAEQIDQAHDYIDVLQIGARNMYNYELLKEAGRCGKPVLLKRGISATLQEFVSAAEYIMLQGNVQVILCERGIRTFETHTRNTIDLNGVAALKAMTPLPVLVDPSHGTGRPELVRPLSRAAIACGADGLIIEVHDQPHQALSDGEQAISSSLLKDIVADTRKIHAALNDVSPAFAPPTVLPTTVR